MTGAQSLQRGFTLPELLVTGVVFGVLAVLAVIFIHPADYSPAQRDGERWADISRLAHALKRYAADHDGLPEDITKEGVMIGSDEGTLNLCSILVPHYLKDVPVDPLVEEETPGETCREGAPAYVSAYMVHRTDDSVIVDALLAEESEQISVSVKL